jgi:NADP-dependent 3-hydroxy acid dehydrogenase YdfG
MAKGRTNPHKTQLFNKIIVVTGGTAGIGKALIEEL